MNLTSASLLSDAMEENLTALANSSLVDMSQPVMSLPDPIIKLAHDILICVLLISVMFAMGCHITCGEVRYQFLHASNIMIVQ